MRYSVRYAREANKWSVIDKAIANQVVGMHATRAEAYHQAFVEQERWRKFDPVADRLARLHTDSARSLVVG